MNTYREIAMSLPLLTLRGPVRNKLKNYLYSYDAVYIVLFYISIEDLLRVDVSSVYQYAADGQLDSFNLLHMKSRSPLQNHREQKFKNLKLTEDCIVQLYIYLTTLLGSF